MEKEVEVYSLQADQMAENPVCPVVGLLEDPLAGFPVEARVACSSEVPSVDLSEDRVADLWEDQAGR